MSRSYYQLQIFCEETSYFQISEFLSVKPKEVNPSTIWIYEVEIDHEKDKEVYYSFITEFLNLLDGKYEKLRELGIERSSITFWLIYEYDDQCNMEFDSLELRKMGEEEINLCISCY